mmetsp:Transcript_24433/g.55079  ORF Transcript_24433/g.55079 Transcript_24433/m.55079 type:complete len:276 (+) Transcript_24433:506-1333(+)
MKPDETPSREKPLRAGLQKVHERTKSSSFISAGGRSTREGHGTAFILRIKAERPPFHAQGSYTTIVFSSGFRNCPTCLAHGIDLSGRKHLHPVAALCLGSVPLVAKDHERCRCREFRGGKQIEKELGGHFDRLGTGRVDDNHDPARGLDVREHGLAKALVAGEVHHLNRLSRRKRSTLVGRGHGRHSDRNSAGANLVEYGGLAGPAAAYQHYSVHLLPRCPSRDALSVISASSRAHEEENGGQCYNDEGDERCRVHDFSNPFAMGINVLSALTFC